MTYQDALVESLHGTPRLTTGRNTGITGGRLYSPGMPLPAENVGTDPRTYGGLNVPGLEAPEAAGAPTGPAGSPAASSLVSDFQRRGGGTGGPWKGAGKGALKGAELAMYTGGIAAPILVGGGAVIGGIAGAINKKAKTAPTDFMLGDAQQALQRGYQTYLGREASPEELRAQLAGQGLKPGDRYVGEQGLLSVLNSLQQSEEAKKFAAGVGGAGATPVTSSPDVTAPAAFDPSNGMVGAGQFQRHADSRLSNAFDLGRAQNPEKSAKDAFAFAANQAALGGNPANLTSMQAAEQWFRTHVAPTLEQYGHKVVDVKGDKAYVIAKDGEGWVDFGGRTGDPSADLYWGAEGPGGGGGNQSGPAPLNLQGGLSNLLAGNPTQAIAAALQQQAGGSDYLRELLARLGAA